MLNKLWVFVSVAQIIKQWKARKYTFEIVFRERPDIMLSIWKGGEGRPSITLDKDGGMGRGEGDKIRHFLIT